MRTVVPRITRYLGSGAVGLFVNLGSYHLLVANLGFAYLLGSVIAVSLSTVVGFLMQKYWTFAERDHARAPRQFALYAVLAAWNVGLNTFIVFLLVEYAGFHYLLAQASGAGTVALSSFFVYRYYIFAPVDVGAVSDMSGTERQS